MEVLSIRILPVRCQSRYPRPSDDNIVEELVISSPHLRTIPRGDVYNTGLHFRPKNPWTTSIRTTMHMGSIFRIIMPDILNHPTKIPVFWYGAWNLLAGFNQPKTASKFPCTKVWLVKTLAVFRTAFEHCGKFRLRIILT